MAKLKVVACCKLENGFHRVETQGQSNCYFFRWFTWFVPKPNQPCVSPTIGLQFMHFMTGMDKNIVSNPNGLASKNTPLTKPQHHIKVDSCTYDQHGVFKPSTRSFGIQDESEFLSVQNEASIISMGFTTSYMSWLKVTCVEMQIFAQGDLYDCRSSQFVKSKCRRSWVFERTMARKLARELEKGRMGGLTFQHKGVRWRPERKHPWVVEIKLKKKKKLWVGNFDTLEEAIKAYDVAAIQNGKRPPPKFDDKFPLIHVNMSNSPFNDCQDSKGCIIPTRTLPMYHPSKSLVNLGVELNGGVDSSTTIPRLVECPMINLHGDSLKMGTNISIKNFEMENTKIDSYYMFASDLPSMPHVSYDVHENGPCKSTTQNIVPSL